MFGHTGEPRANVTKSARRQPRADALAARARRLADDGRRDDVTACAEELLDGDDDGVAEAVGAPFGPGDDFGIEQVYDS